MSEGSVFRRKDGKWCAKYKDARGTWKYIYRKTKGEARQALREALKVRNKGPGIVNWALAGLARLNERDQFEYPAAVLDATTRFGQDNDLPRQFLEECCERAPSEQLFYTGEYLVYAGELTKAYNAWAIDKGHKPWSEHSLAPEWKRLKLEKGKRHGKGVPYYGVKLV